ncbi:hypothetical protein L3Q82_017018 [Scortum barcoo]|uniref:Uncharacterized protein n=1 Tax=Scortum barcoo TaxID=214431 RepID=A0ACB8X8W5_9TELE|nr:hypothetical protein L3Q82_017018 [Scortum barcoo]
MNETSARRKAEEFTNRCLRPAVEDFVKRSLGPDIIDEMLKNKQFSNRIECQYSILLDLLTQNDFEKYLSYIGSYENYVKKWILDQIVTHFSNGSRMSQLEDQRLQSSISSINDAINKAKTENSGNMKTFVEDVCQELGDKLVISQDALGAFMILNNADQPQNELFNKLIGCGKQCPFCKAPCEAGGKEHTEHWTSLHRPEGLGSYRWTSTKKLLTDICSSAVISDVRFHCNATNGKYHPYKRYKEIFPDWHITPDGSLQASDYWKYVLAKFNNKFAKEYNAQPADIPSSWKDIKHQQAEASLKESFNIK